MPYIVAIASGDKKSSQPIMNYNDFVCECTMRTGAAVNPANGRLALSERESVTRALNLAETLVHDGFLSVTFESLLKKWVDYQYALEHAQKRLDGRWDMDRLSGDITDDMKRFIDRKNDFYTKAGQMPELIEQARNSQIKKNGANASISPETKAFFDWTENLLNNSNFEIQEEMEFFGAEKRFLDTLEPHKKRDPTAQNIHNALLKSREAERRFIERLKPLWKSAGAALKKRACTKAPKTLPMTSDALR